MVHRAYPPERKSRRAPHWLWMTLLAVIVALAAACGGSDETPEPTATTAPAATATPAPAPTATVAPTATATASAVATAVNIVLTIEPSTGTYGDGFAYTVSGLEPDAAYVLFIHQPNGFWVEMNAWGDETGAGLLWEDDYTFQKVPLTEVWFSTPGEPFGLYVVELRAEDGETILATANFTVEEPQAVTDPTSAIELAIVPDTGTYGDAFELSVSELDPDQHYALVIREPNGTEWWDDVWANAAGDGLLAQDERNPGKMPLTEFWYSEKGEPAGEYVVELRAEDRKTILATATFTIVEAEELTLTIDPPSGMENTKFAYAFTGLATSETYEYVVLLPDDSEYRARVTADSDAAHLIAAEDGPEHAAGDTLDGWLAATGAQTGGYVVQLRAADGETVLAESRFVVLKPVTDSGIELRASPTVGPRNTDYVLLVSGNLSPEQSYQYLVRFPNGVEEVIDVRYDPTFMTMIITSGLGRNDQLLGWNVKPGDPLGEYIVELCDPTTGDVLARTTFIVE